MKKLLAFGFIMSLMSADLLAVIYKLNPSENGAISITVTDKRGSSRTFVKDEEQWMQLMGDGTTKPVVYQMVTNLEKFLSANSEMQEHGDNGIEEDDGNGFGFDAEYEVMREFEREDKKVPTQPVKRKISEGGQNPEEAPDTKIARVDNSNVGLINGQNIRYLSDSKNITDMQPQTPSQAAETVTSVTLAPKINIELSESIIALAKRIKAAQNQQQQPQQMVTPQVQQQILQVQPQLPQQQTIVQQIQTQQVQQPQHQVQQQGWKLWPAWLTWAKAKAQATQSSGQSSTDVQNAQQQLQSTTQSVPVQQQQQAQQRVITHAELSNILKLISKK